VKSDLVYFAEAYRSMPHRGFSCGRTAPGGGSRSLRREAPGAGIPAPLLRICGPRKRQIGSGIGAPGTSSISRTTVRLLSRTRSGAGLAGKTADSLRSLKVALHRRPFTVSRRSITEYQFAEICEWLYEATRNPKYPTRR